MRHYQFGRTCKEPFQHLTPVHQHVARAAAHEEFHTGILLRGHCQDFIQIIVGSTQEEGIVHMHAPLCHLHALAPVLHGGCLWHHVGHIQHRGNATCRRRHALGVHIGLGGHAWLSEVHVVVYHTGQKVHARGIHHLASVLRLYLATYGDTLYPALTNQQGADMRLPIVYYRCIADNRLHHAFLLLNFVMRSFITPKRASLNMPPDILLVPNSRFTNTTGTSFILKPRRRAVYFISIWKA